MLVLEVADKFTGPQESAIVAALRLLCKTESIGGYSHAIVSNSSSFIINFVIMKIGEFLNPLLCQKPQIYPL